MTDSHKENRCIASYIHLYNFSDFWLLAAFWKCCSLVSLLGFKGQFFQDRHIRLHTFQSDTLLTYVFHLGKTTSNQILYNAPLNGHNVMANWRTHEHTSSFSTQNRGCGLDLFLSLCHCFKAPHVRVNIALCFMHAFANIVRGSRAYFEKHTSRTLAWQHWLFVFFIDYETPLGRA